jgi:hypothetical protein
MMSKIGSVRTVSLLIMKREHPVSEMPPFLQDSRAMTATIEARLGCKRHPKPRR